MMIFERFLIFIILCVNMLCYSNNITTNTTDSNNITEQFIPTNQWQTVKKGQAIPKGLHIRVNFETGVTEAKLLDPDEKSKSLSVVPEENKTEESDTVERKKYTTLLRSEIEQALKNLPGETFDGTKAKFRTLEDIKQEFKGMNMMVKTDVEVMQELFNKYEVINKLFPSTKNNMKDKLDHESIDSFVSVEMLNILTDMEYLVHQIDNGVEFVKMKGFEKMIYPHLNASDVTLKAEAIKLMGSCLQNNINVQIYALEINAGDHLLKILALEKNEHVKARAIYALGALIRRFPLAQKQIISKHGMDVLIKILLSDNPSYVKLKLKILSLLEDLILEHQSVLENHVPGDPGEDEKLRQYYQVEMMSKLSNPQYCEILSKLLQEYFDNDNTNIYDVDKLFSIINTFSHMCKHHHYKDKKLLALFHRMQNVYGKIVESKDNESTDNLNSDESLEDDDDDKELYQNILDMIENYINELNQAKMKDEL